MPAFRMTLNRSFKDRPVFLCTVSSFTVRKIILKEGIFKVRLQRENVGSGAFHQYRFDFELVTPAQKAYEV
jgi:hypothetical protein